MRGSKKFSPEERTKIAALRAKNKLENPPTIHMITPNYRIVGRQVCLTLEKLKNGEWEAIGHHTELKWAIVSVSKHVTRDHLDDLIFVAQQLEEIKEICKKIK